MYEHPYAGALLPAVEFEHYGRLEHAVIYPDGTALIHGSGSHRPMLIQCDEYRNRGLREYLRDGKASPVFRALVEAIKA